MKDLKDITLMVWDDNVNFNLPSTVRAYGGGNLYKKVYQFNSRDEFKSLYDKLSENENLVFCCHVKNEDFSGYFDFRNSRLKEDFKIPEINYLSSGDSGDVMHNLYDKHKISEKIILYSELLSGIQSGEIKHYEKKDIQKKLTLSYVNEKDSIFLSHSSKDKDIVISFRDFILVQGLGFKISKIKLTSDQANGIPAGLNIPQDLKNSLKQEMGLFIQFLSKDYLESRVCLNEEGAAWCLLEDEKMFVPLMLTGYSRSFVTESNKSIDINDKESLINIYDDRKLFFGSDVKSSHFLHKVEEFLLILKSKRTDI